MSDKKQTHKHELTLLLLSSTLLFSSFGMNVVLFPSLLLRHGIDAGLIGFSATVELIASIVIALFVPILAKKYSVFHTLWAMILGYVGVVLLLPVYVNYFVWLLLIFIVGVNFFGIMIIIQSLYNQFVHNHRRGWYSALMAVAICTGMTMGPIIVGLMGVSEYVSFLTSGCLAGLTIFPTFFLLKRRAKIPPHKHVAFLYFLKRTPVIFIAKFTLEFIVTSIFFLGLVYLVRHNHSPEQAGLVFSAFTVSAILDLGVGLLVDRFNKYRLLSIGVIGVCASMGMLLFYAYHLPSTLAIFFVLGVFIGFMHLSLTSLLNNRFPKRSLVSANATLQLIGSVGGIAGTLIVGFTMEFYAHYGFPVVLMGVSVLYLCAAFAIRTKGACRLCQNCVFGLKTRQK